MKVRSLDGKRSYQSANDIDIEDIVKVDILRKDKPQGSADDGVTIHRGAKACNSTKWNDVDVEELQSATGTTETIRIDPRKKEVDRADSLVMWKDLLS